jgi:hypothetical protein
MKKGSNTRDINFASELKRAGIFDVQKYWDIFGLPYVQESAQIYINKKLTQKVYFQNSIWRTVFCSLHQIYKTLNQKVEKTLSSGIKRYFKRASQLKLREN